MTVGPLTLLMPDMVRPTVEAWLVTELKPVALEKSITEAVVVLVTLAFSIFFNAEGVTEPVITA